MRIVNNNKSVQENFALLDDFINPQLSNIKPDDDKKQIELCHVGKFLMNLDNDTIIESLSESPDFILLAGQNRIGLEHQILVDSASKQKEGFFENIISKAQIEIKKDNELPNFLASCYIMPYTNFQLNQKGELISIVTETVKEFVLNNRFIENPIIDHISIMPHSDIHLSCNLGWWWQKSVTNDLILKAINKKEKLIDLYKSNGPSTQWLLIVIGGVGKSSFVFDKKSEIDINSRFDKIYLLEDFYNKLYELK